MMAANISRNYKRIYVSKPLGEWLIPERYDNLKPIGSGAYGQVCSAFDTVLKMKVAIKKIGRPLQTLIHAKRAYREIRLLKHMLHGNVIGLFDVFIPNPDDDYDVYVVTHLMESDLSSLLKSLKLNSIHVKFLVYQLLRGIKYIHSAGIIHRDLKPQNIAVNENCELRILDFGLARPIQPDMTATGYVVTRWYRAPEVMLNWTHYNQTVDVWAVGCIMAEMLTGRTLFPGENHIDQLHKTLAVTGTPAPDLLAKLTTEEARRFIQTLPQSEKKDFKKLFAGADPLAIDLLEKMLELDPDKRITAAQALAHGYLEEYRDNQDEESASVVPYVKSYDDVDVGISDWRKLILDEVVSFVPRLPDDFEEKFMDRETLAGRMD